MPARSPGCPPFLRLPSDAGDAALGARKLRRQHHRDDSRRHRRLTADILFAEPRIANEVVFVAGDTITYARLADIVEAVLARKVERAGWTVATLEAELAQDPGNAFRKYRSVFANGRGVAWDVNTTFNAANKIRTTDVAAWAAETLPLIFPRFDGHR